MRILIITEDELKGLAIAQQTGRMIEFTNKELAVLRCLMRSPGRPVSRTRMIEQVWQYQFDVETNLIDVYVNRLRRKLRDDDHSIIRTVRGVGYVLAAD